MLDLILLFFGARYIGDLALRKGLKRGAWIGYTVAAWLVAELIGMGIAVILLGYRELWTISLFAMFCGLGGFLLVHARIKKQPDNPGDNRKDLL